MEISIPVMIFAFGNFILLLVLLRIFLFKPVRKMMDARQQTISDGLAAAEQAKQQAANAGEEIRAQIEQARGEAEAIIASARVAGDDLKKQLLEEARVEARGITENARQALAKEREDAITALRKEAAALAVNAAGRILAEELNEAQQQALLHKYIVKVGQLQ